MSAKPRDVQEGRVRVVTNARGNKAPHVGIAEEIPSFNTVLSEQQWSRSRLNKTLVTRIFQSLDALIVAAAAALGCMQASNVPLTQTAFGIVAPFLVLPFFLIWGLAAFGA